MVRFTSDDNVGGSDTSAAFLALPPAPPTRNHRLRLIAEYHFAGVGMVNVILPKIRKALCTVGEMNSNRPLQRTAVNYGNRQPVTDAHEISDIHERVDAWNITFFGKSA